MNVLFEDGGIGCWSQPISPDSLILSVTATRDRNFHSSRMEEEKKPMTLHYRLSLALTKRNRRKYVKREWKWKTLFGGNTIGQSQQSCCSRCSQDQDLRIQRTHSKNRLRRWWNRFIRWKSWRYRAISNFSLGFKSRTGDHRQQVSKCFDSLYGCCQLFGIGKWPHLVDG